MKNKNEIITSDLRTKLKEIMKKEINNLPQLLDDIEPKERINYILKFMPYVFPKVDTITHSTNEPIRFN